VSDEDHLEGGNVTLILIITASLFAAWIHAKEQQTERMITKEVNPITRESFGPYYVNEMERKLARAEARAKGMAVGYDCKQFKPQPCQKREEQPVINDMDRSSLSGLIIEGAMNERH
tara:strand:+ start:280 stop:630 length:351 start_codon:yes stop_codon:yes gene_type:complete